MNLVDTDINTSLKGYLSHGKEVEEEDNSAVLIKTPFNPNDIKVRTEPHTIGQLVDRLQHNELNLSTDFQRLPDLWNDTKKSRFIESLILKLPIPTFYFAENSISDVWDVVDGLQRVSTLKHFIINEVEPLILTNLEFLKDYNNKTFKELPRELRRRINTFPITIYIIEKGTPDIVKFNIFSRINQGGLILKPQEIRHAIHQGVAADLLADLVRNEDIKNEKGEVIKSATKTGKAFAKATDYKIRSDRMQDRDFANRFLSFYLISYNEYQPDLDSFMNKGLSKAQKLSPQEVEDVKTAFRESMILSEKVFGNDAFRKRYHKNDGRKPINKALFEVLSVCFAQLSTSERLILLEKKSIFKEKFIILHNTNERFVSSISQGTALKENVEQRFQDIEKIITETLKDA